MVKQIGVNVEDVIQGISRGYAQLGRLAETITDWMPFINGFSNAIRNLKFTLELPNDPTTFDPGNLRDQVLQLVRFVMQRRINLSKITRR